MKDGISPEEMEGYRAGARAREAARQQALAQQRATAWEWARRAAQVLREQFGVTRVVVFGSLAHGVWFHERSDVDLAVAGLPPALYWRADSVLSHLDSAPEFDLVTIEDAPEALRAAIAAGVEL